MIPSDEPERTVSSADLAQPIRDTADTILEPHNGSGPAGTSSPSGRYIRPVFHAEGGLGAIHSERRAATSPGRQLSNAKPDQSQLRSLGFGLGRRTAGLGHRPKTYRNRGLWNPVSRRSFY